MEDVKTLLNLHRVLLNEFSSMKNCLRLTNWAGLNKCDRVWKNAKSFFFVFWRRFQCGRRLMIANEIANIYHYWRLEKSRGLFINKTRKKFKLSRSLFLSCPATKECFPLMLTLHCNYLLMHNVTTSNNTIGTNVHTRKQALADLIEAYLSAINKATTLFSLSTW